MKKILLIVLSLILCVGCSKNEVEEIDDGPKTIEETLQTQFFNETTFEIMSNVSYESSLKRSLIYLVSKDQLDFKQMKTIYKFLELNDIVLNIIYVTEEDRETNYFMQDYEMPAVIMIDKGFITGHIDDISNVEDYKITEFLTEYVDYDLYNDSETNVGVLTPEELDDLPEASTYN